MVVLPNKKSFHKDGPRGLLPTVTGADNQEGASGSGMRPTRPGTSAASRLSTPRAQNSRMSLSQLGRPKTAGAGGENDDGTPCKPVYIPPEHVLQTRLTQALTKLDSVNHESKKIRDQVDLLRKDRLVLNRVWKQLTDGIRHNSRQLTTMVEQDRAHKHEMMDAKSKHESIKKQVESERKGFKVGLKQAKEMARNHDLQKREFEIQLRKEQMGGHNYENYVVTEEENKFSEDQTMRRILKNSVLNTIQRRHIRIHTKNINVFEQAFATIKSTTGISDIDEIVKIFIKLEERNFSLMTYVNKLNSDIEGVENQCRAMQCYCMQ